MTEKFAPSWLDQTWGHAQNEWDEAFQQCRDTLVRWARDGHIGIYSELVGHIRAVDRPEGAFTGHGAKIGLLLGQVSAREWLEDRPLLSAMVMGSEEQRPSKAFFDLARDLGFEVGRSPDAEDRFWFAQVERCQAHRRAASDGATREADRG